MSNRFQILSLDGGGLKGIFTTSLLAYIEQNTNKKIVDYFDLITGTSTGGIIAIALGLGFSPKQILDFYVKEGPKIFPAQELIKRLIYSSKHIFYRKYSSNILKTALSDKKYFGDALLGKSSKRLIIPSFDPIRNDVYIYKTAHHKRLQCDYKVPAWQVAVATASAPTYFPIFINNGGVRLIDGGIWANNPTMVALSEALGYLEQKQQDVALLSIGTTEDITSCNFLQYHGGILSWSAKVIKYLMHGQSISANNQAYHILGNDRFLRIDPVIGKKYAMDKIYDELIGIGQTEGRIKINEIDEIFLQHKASKFIPEYST